MRVIQSRKKFINEHPKKIELARKIIEARKDKKIVTFSKKVDVAEQIGYGEVYTGKTFERLDGKEILLQKYAPVIDKITLEDSLLNGWVSPYIEYEVLINVDDIAQYEEMNKEFTEHFEFFNYDFNLAMEMVGKEGWKKRQALRDRMCPQEASASVRKQMLSNITYHAMGL